MNESLALPSPRRAIGVMPLPSRNDASLVAGVAIGPYQHVAVDVLETLPILGWEEDGDGGRRPTLITAWSRRLFGRGLDRWRRDSHLWLEVIHADDRERVADIWRRARASGLERNLEYRIETASGLVWVRDVIHCRDIGGDGRPRLHGICIDVTAEKQVAQLDAELRQSQRLECLGKLTGGIAHDFGNLLTVILGRSELIHAALPVEDPRRAGVRAIRDCARRASSLVARLLRFARRDADLPGVCDLVGTVTEMHELLRPLLGEAIAVALDAETVPRFVRCQRTEVEQIVMNLVVNARDAMPEGGALHIRIRDATVDATGWPGDGPSAGRYGVLEVNDTGCGIEDAMRARIFDSFFTTKGPADGSGLGLSILRRIVNRCGGHVTVTSRIGLGSTFKVYLPCCEGAVLAPSIGRARTLPVLAGSRAA